MPQFLAAMTSLKERFWEPYLPYAVTAVQKSIEDTKDIEEPKQRVSRILEILDDAISKNGLETAQSDLYQGLKCLSYQGALPHDHARKGAPCIFNAMLDAEKYPAQFLDMVRIICASQDDEAVPAEARKKWAEKTYTSRYADFIAEEPNGPQEPDSSKKNCILLQGPAHWFCRENN